MLDSEKYIKLGEGLAMKKLAFVVTVFALFIATSASGETVYFLVAEANTPAHGDSYVLPLTEPNDIAHARDLVKYGRPGRGMSATSAISPTSPSKF